MSLLERSLWTVLTISAAFICISLITDDLQPHRCMLGIPFTLAILAVMASLSILSGGGLMDSIATAIVEPTASRAWWCISAIMCLRCLFGGFSRSAAAENLVSVLLCSVAAFFMLVDVYQRARSWPKFDIPEIGQIRKPRERRPERSAAEPTFSWFGVLSCLLAAVAVYELGIGLTACLGDRVLFDEFFISELGAGKHAELFTTTLLSFGVFMLPFFLNFMVGHDQHVPVEAVKFAAGGCMAVCGIIGIGVWDLTQPLHYLSIAIWLWPLAVILDQHVPTPRGFVDLRFPTWIVKACMATYVMAMIVLPFGEGGRLLCITSQRFVVLATLVWLLLLWKVMTAESLGIGQQLNGDAV